MIGRGLHGVFHPGFHHAGPYGWFSNLWLTIGLVVAAGVVAAIVWGLGRVGNQSYEGALERKREELGLPPDGDGGGASA